MSKPFEQVHIIINPAAGRDEPVLNTLNDVLHPAGIRWEVSITHQKGDAARLAQAAVEAGADLVAAYGGDGTIGEAANGLVGSDVPLAVLPGGTGNAVAAELGIPGWLRPAVELIAAPDSQRRPIDLGRAGEQYFVLRASLGAHTQLAENASREMKDRFGNLAYLMSALNTLSNPQPYTYYLTLDGEQHVSEGITCLINNSGSIGKLNVSMSAEIDPGDGLLDVFVLKDYFDPLLAIAASVPPLEELAANMLQYWQAREIEIATLEPQAVHLDGEPFGETPLHVSVAPGALKVLVPAAQEF